MTYNKPQQLCYVVNPLMEEAFFATVEWASSYALNWPECQILMSFAGKIPAGHGVRKLETIRVDFSHGLLNTIGAL